LTSKKETIPQKKSMKETKKLNPLRFIGQRLRWETSLGLLP